MNVLFFQYKFDFRAATAKTNLNEFVDRVLRSVACCVVATQLLALLCASGQAQSLKAAPECTEYLAKGACKVTITIPEIKPGTDPKNLAAPTHADITMRHNTSAVIVLENASPLMTCALTTTPAVLTRDPTTSITTFISTLATLGLPGGELVVQPNAAILAAPTPLPTRSPARDDAQKIAAELVDLNDASRKQGDNYKNALKDYQTARNSVLENWRYHYTDDDAFVRAATEMYNDVGSALADPLPSSDDYKALTTSAQQIEKELESFAKAYPGYREAQDWYAYAKSQLSETGAKIKSDKDTLLPQVQFLNDLQALLKPAFTWLNAKSNPPGSGIFRADPEHPHVMTTIYLPMSLYAQKQVTEAITCKDAASKDPAFDTITFTAYYEPQPVWDFSAAAFFSLVPGRTLGTYNANPGPSATSMTMPTTVLAATDHSSYQFVPGGVFEYHPINRRCPWVSDWPDKLKPGTGYHPFGYVCSVGLAGGILINPNNGSTRGEFFEGISLGIHRFALLIGNHTGKYQEFADGYAVGQTFPITVMPATTRRWTNHPAIGVAFRIPIR